MHLTRSHALKSPYRFLDGGGAMAEAIEAHDWSRTPLGPIETWPPVLRIAISTMVNSAFPKCLCWGDTLISIYNDAFIQILGRKHPCLGQPFEEIWREAWDTIGPMTARALAGEATFIENFELEIARFGHAETAYFTFCYSPIRDETGKVCGMLDTVIETSDAVRAEHTAQLRNRELIHRSRNSFAVVSVLIKQTHRNSETLEEAEAKILQRLSSLNRAQNVLADTRGIGAGIRQVIEGALTLFEHGDGAISAEGPDIRLGSEQVIALAMALHELGTNAAKYGALSVPDGHIAVRWEIDNSVTPGLFRLTWQENGGPPVSTPTRRGFGSFLIDKALAAQFEGDVEIDYAPSGLHLTLSTDARNLVRSAAEKG